MGYVVQARCLDCGYESSNITIGNAKHLVCICRSCRSVVNPERVPFRYTIRPCPNCGTTLGRDDTLDMMNTPVDHEGTVPTKIKCPRCDDGSLAFKTQMHFSRRRQDSAPTVNSTVHGQMRNGRLHIPGMILFGAQPILEGLPDDVGDRTMELLTKDVTQNAEEISSITFSFVRCLE